MKAKVFFILIVLIPAVCLMDGCKQNKKPSVTATEPETEAATPEAAESEAEEPEADIKGNKPLGVRSGIIEYTYSGDKTGKSTQYFDDYGMKSAVYAEIITQGEQSKGWSLTIGEDQYMWNPSKPGEGMKAKNPMAKMMTETSAKEMGSYMESMYEKMGMVKSGTEMFQGKECTVFKGDMGKVLIWEGLLMMMEMNMGTVVSRQEVTSIKTNIPVDGKYFDIPKNVTFSEIPGL